MANMSVTGYKVNVNGHEVPLFALFDDGCPANAASTDWLLVRFDRFVTRAIRHAFHDYNQLKIYEKLDDDNVHLCKYDLEDISLLFSNECITHITLYPSSVVPVPELVPDPSHGDQPLPNNVNGVASERMNGLCQSAGDQDVMETSSVNPCTDNNLSLVIELHPDPNQTPEEVLHEIVTKFEAEHLDSEIEPPGNLVRVNLNRRYIPAIASIDSVRSIRKVRKIIPLSILVDEALGTNSLTTSFAWTGLGEVVHVADSGFDKGSNTDVHPAFEGRVLAAITYKNTTDASDRTGHGTHVAGSVLGDFSRLAGSPFMSMKGTAPKARLVSLALDLMNMPPLTSLFTHCAPGVPRPIIIVNAWGEDIDEWDIQEPYGPGDAYLVDRAMAIDPNLCIVFAAGNDGEMLTPGRTPGLTPAGLQQQVCGWASAKNCITVGETKNTRPIDEGRYSPFTGTIFSPRELTIQSSRGPTMENRLGIDVVAPGQVVLSARSRSIDHHELVLYDTHFGRPLNGNLLFSAGTSMASAAVAGCVACLRQAYRQTYNDNKPSGAMLKALIIHGAVDLEGTRFTNTTSAGSRILTMTAAPNTFQGFGLVNMPNSIVPLVNPVTATKGTMESKAAPGSTVIRTLILPSGISNLIVTLAYTDLPGADLQNIIELEVHTKLMSHSPVIVLPRRPTDPLKQWPPIPFAKNNVAKVIVRNPEVGFYSIVLKVQTLKESAPFAVVWSAV